MDIDERVLAWSRAHHVATLGDAARRMTLLEQDVRKPSRVRHDVICALNFSWVFETRAEMRAYLVGVRRALSRPGRERGIEAYRARAHAEKQRAWLAYIVAVP